MLNPDSNSASLQSAELKFAHRHAKPASPMGGELASEHTFPAATQQVRGSGYSNYGPILYRKRLIPDECVRLEDDEIIYIDSNIIVTKWRALHPKPKLDHGYSCYFLKKNFKISKFLLSDDSLIYWYCDIIDYTYDNEGDEYVFRDLLADVIVYPDGFVKVVDLDEFEEALDKELLTSADVRKALRSLDSLLRIIYDGRFNELQDEIEKRI